MPRKVALHGHQIELSEGRHVFHAVAGGVHYLRFRNECAVDTRIKLSDDACDALVELLTGPRELYRWVLHINGQDHDALTWEKMP